MVHRSGVPTDHAAFVDVNDGSGENLVQPALNDLLMLGNAAILDEEKNGRIRHQYQRNRKEAVTPQDNLCRRTHRRRRRYEDERIVIGERIAIDHDAQHGRE